MVMASFFNMERDRGRQSWNMMLQLKRCHKKSEEEICMNLLSLKEMGWVRKCVTYIEIHNFSGWNFIRKVGGVLLFRFDLVFVRKECHFLNGGMSFYLEILLSFIVFR